MNCKIYYIKNQPTMFGVFIRSMSTYISPCLDLQYTNGHYHMFRAIGFHNTYNDAYTWLISIGKSFTEKFYDHADQGSAFVIIEQSNQDAETFGNELDDDKLNLFMLDRSRYHYVFSEESYKMCLNEHLMYLSNDWDQPFPIWLKYVQDDGTIITGCNLDHFIKVQEMTTYNDDNVGRKKKNLQILKNFVRMVTKNIYLNPQV